MVSMLREFQRESGDDFTQPRYHSFDGPCICGDPLAENILMVVYSSLDVPGTEFIPLDGDTLPTCINEMEPHVVSSANATTMMRPAVVKNNGDIVHATFSMIF